MSDYNSGGFVSVPTERVITSAFYGVRNAERIPDGYFQDMLNMTAAKYPCLATRNTRMKMQAVNNEVFPGEPVATAEYEDGILFAMSNGIVCYKNKSYDLFSKVTAVTQLGKQVFCIPGGAYLRDNLSQCEYAEFHAKHKFKVTFCDTSFSDISVNASEKRPDSPVNGAYWYDRANKGLYKYSESSETWVAVSVIYVKLTAEDFDFSKIHEGDALRITSETEQADSFVAAVFSDNIVIEGEFNSGIISDSLTLSVERRFPALQYICSHSNRIWGCYYDGTLNEIYASALGDPLNWYRYRGISTDSYAVSCGESGDFTGCSELGDSVVFF